MSVIFQRHDRDACRLLINCLRSKRGIKIQLLPRDFFGYAGIPKPKTSLEGIGIVSQPYVARQATELFGITAPENDVVGLQRRSEMLDDVGDLLPPLLLAESCEARRSHIVLESPALVIRQMTELHRLQHAINDHRGAEART